MFYRLLLFSFLITIQFSSFCHKRTKSQIKFKGELDLVAKVIGWEEGTGRNSGRLGALVCEHNDIRFNVGTGFSDEKRVEYTEEYIVGKIISVKYNSVIKDVNGNKSLFLPIFLEERLDKDTI